MASNSKSETGGVFDVIFEVMQFELAAQPSIRLRAIL